MLSKPNICQKLGLKHALSDASAGYLAGCWLLTMSLNTLAPLFLAYNLIAFGCQPVFSLLPEKHENTAIHSSLVLAIVALMLPPESYWLTLFCIATASALFHVSAGSVSLKSANHDSMQLSWFIAPGVLGLLTGMAAGISEVTLVSWVLIAGLLCSLFLSTSAVKSRQAVLPAKQLSISFCLIAALLLLISIRSLVWSFYQGNLTLSAPLLLSMAAAAFIGKLTGGWLDSRLSTKQWLLPALIMASGFLLFTEKTGSVITLAAGLACLQSTTPVMLKMLDQHLQKPALSAALGLGVAIALGGGVLSLLMSINSYPLDWIWLVPALLALACLMILQHLKLQRR